MKKLIPFVVIVLAFCFLKGPINEPRDLPEPAVRSSTPVPGTTEALRNGEQTRGSGVVVRILADDRDGSRHQRFIIKLSTGRTLLIAHNIDLAPRISALREGDTVAFNGIFEANDKGGLIHWTHRDPQGRHEPGWLKHKGQTYQ